MRMQNLLLIAKSFFISAFSLTLVTIASYLVNLKAKSYGISRLYFHLKKFSMITAIFAFVFFILATWNILQLKMVIALLILPISSFIAVILNRGKAKKI